MKRKNSIKAQGTTFQPIKRQLTPEEEEFEKLNSDQKDAYKRYKANGHPNCTVVNWKDACVQHKLELEKKKAIQNDNVEPYILANNVQGLQLVPLGQSN
jgi:hypothetical protein